MSKNGHKQISGRGLSTSSAYKVNGAASASAAAKFGNRSDDWLISGDWLAAGERFKVNSPKHKLR
jgi:hypothetical protein